MWLCRTSPLPTFWDTFPPSLGLYTPRLLHGGEGQRVWMQEGGETLQQGLGVGRSESGKKALEERHSGLELDGESR